MTPHEHPLFEFDPSPEAVINPSIHRPMLGFPQRAVMCYGFIPEARFATRVSSTTEHEVALRVRALYQYLGRRIDRQDLWALALVRLVEAEASD